MGLTHWKKKENEKKKKPSINYRNGNYLTTYVWYISYFLSPPRDFQAASLQDGLVVAVGVGVAGRVSEETLAKLLVRTGPSMTGMYGAAGPCHGRGLPLRHLIGGPPAATIAFSTQS